MALYDHPGLGSAWERHCTDKLRSIGFEPSHTCESRCTHRNIRLNLSVYVDDFNVTGLDVDLRKAWSLVRGVIGMDEATSLGAHVGCRPRKDRPRSSGRHASIIGTCSIALSPGGRRRLPLARNKGRQEEECQAYGTR